MPENSVYERLTPTKSNDDNTVSNDSAQLAQQIYQPNSKELSALTEAERKEQAKDLIDRLFGAIEITDDGKHQVKGADSTDAADTKIAKAPEEKPAEPKAPIDREKIRQYAEILHGDGSIIPGTWGNENKRRELAWSGELNGRLKSLNKDEREALKGEYHQRYGTTLDADYSFLKGDQKDEVNSLLRNKDDLTAQRADRIMTLMDKSKSDYSTMSYVHSDRPNANKELRDTLKSMNAKEIEETDQYFKRVYGKSLQDAVNDETPTSTRDMCTIYLKGSDKLDTEDGRKLMELTNQEREKVDGSPNLTLSSADASRLFEKNFQRLDWNEDGIVSGDEIDRAMNDGDYKGEDAQLVVLLKEKREDLATLSKDTVPLVETYGVTKKDMQKLSEIAAKTDKSEDEQKLIDSVDRNLSRSGNKIMDADKHLWGSNSNPIDSIKPEAINQEKIGDCYFLASVASVAKTKDGKESIKNMIEDNKDGTYTVRFPGDPKPITIDEPTNAELAHGAAAGKDGVWVAVLEKAYAKYHAKETGEKPRYPTEGIDGGQTDEALALLTGRRVKNVTTEETSKEDMDKILTKAMNEDRPVTCEIDDPDDDETEGKKENNSAGLPSGHSYSITGYDPETKMVTVRNPWGRGEPKDENGNAKDGNNDGTFTMTLDEFYRNFSSVQYARNNYDKDKSWYEKIF